MRGEQTIEVAGREVSLAVRSTGEGQPFIWGHGLMGSMAQEDDVAVFDWAEDGAGIRWVRYDARGHGHSQATYDAGGYQWSELASDVLALADTLGARRVALGGVSMGCATSLHAAVEAPERVSALVLVAPPTAWKTRPRQALFYRVLACMVSWIGIGPLRMLSSIEPPGPRSPTVVEMQRALVRHLGEADARALVAALRGAAASDLPPPDALRDLHIPALILAWPNDPVHPVSSAERLVRLLPDAALHVADSMDAIEAWPGLVRAHLRLHTQDREE